MATLTGLFRLGRDAELRFTPNGDPVANLALAYNHGVKGQDGNRPTQWVDAALYGKRAESLIDYLVKGAAISAILQDPHIRTYQKNDGTQGFTLSARILDLEFAGGGQRQEGQQRSEPAQRPAPQQTQAPRQQQPRQQAPAGNLADMDDDIPF